MSQDPPSPYTDQPPSLNEPDQSAPSENKPSNSGCYGLQIGSFFIGIKLGRDPPGFGLKVPGVLVGGWSADDENKAASEPATDDK